ncbi:uncharacterized protein LOC129780385 [Toxorhynchites rutilus septentrionalis]|uniref:uncharacterized protein LOC129780385 n=1 Tax=Toxorhynchites rutilus septentrionalis TaxID=329112 RepID=UPI002479612B|nr:uncharacterized protein LOC129780385 [Toxorhynchites rutilus septentrionalis]
MRSLLYLLHLALLTIIVTSEHNDSSVRSVNEGRKMLFPSLSTLQFSVCTSSGSPFFIPKKKYAFRRLGVNVGFQANYGLPYRLKDFYTPPTWARAMVDIVKGKFLPTEVISARAVRKRRSGRQLSAGDIYLAFDEALQSYGYDEGCMIKSVCELAHSPFHNVTDDIYTEIIHFILTPSEHQAFDANERKMRIKYEAAERLGKHGADCNLLYPKCKKSFLGDISNFLEDNKDTFLK